MKYRCIKKYPNGPEVGDILEQINGNSYYTCKNKNYYAGEWNYPEFFEEVIEKEYEILELIAYHGCKSAYDYGIGSTYNYPLSNIYNSREEWVKKFLSAKAQGIPEYWRIYKVKRLSDNEVFSIGDKLDKYKATIKEFRIDSFGFRVITDAKGDGLVTSEVSWNLETCNKYVEPKISFTTEDNHVVYEGESFKGYFITDEESSVNESSRAYGYWSGGTNPVIGKYFKTKEAANKYIDSKNKERLLDSKVLSINDVYKIIEKVTFNSLYDRYLLTDGLKELVKSKQ